MTIGDRLKIIRKEQKLSFEEAALRAGVVRSMIQRWENGQSTAVSQEYLEFYYKAGYSTNWILFGELPKNKVKLERSLVTDITEIQIRLDVQESLINYLMRLINKDPELIKSNILLKKKADKLQTN